MKYNAYYSNFRSIESLYEELVEQGIIKKVQDVRVSDYEGEYSYLGTTLRQANIEPMPSLSDVRRVVTEFGVLPLGMSYHPTNMLIFVSSLKPMLVMLAMC